MFAQQLVGRHDLAAGNPARATLMGSNRLASRAKVILVGNHKLNNVSPQADISAVNFYLSGGLSNLDPNQAIGGQISSTQVKFQSFVQETPIPGITVVKVGNSGLGVGTLSYETVEDGIMVRWVPYGSSPEAGRLVKGDGYYGVLTGDGVGTGFMVVDVDWDSLSGGSGSSSVEVRSEIPNLFEDLQASDAKSGKTSHRCVYVKNEHPTKTLSNLQLSSNRDSNTGSVLEVAADTAGAGDGVSTGVATTPASETADPALNFGATATLPDLLPGQTAAFWLRREIHEGWYKELNPDIHLLLFGGAFT